jgi:hypothetical protein
MLCNRLLGGIGLKIRFEPAYVSAALTNRTIEIRIKRQSGYGGRFQTGSAVRCHSPVSLVSAVVNCDQFVDLSMKPLSRR